MKVLVLNGPNLGRLDIRDSSIYGDMNYAELVSHIESVAKSENGKVLSTQTVYERKEYRPVYVEEYGDENQPKVARMEMPSPPVEKTVVIKSDNTKMLKMISKVKKNVVDHMGQ